MVQLWKKEADDHEDSDYYDNNNFYYYDNNNHYDYDNDDFSDSHLSESEANGDDDNQ